MRWVVALLCLLAACAGGGRAQTHTYVVSAYPVEWAVRSIVGADADILDLARPGVEPHDLELTSDDIDAIDAAKRVFYIGDGFQRAVERAAKQAGDRAIDIAAGVATRKNDPHFWLDPSLYAKAADRVRGNATKLKSDLSQLDGEYRSALSHCERRTFVTTHESFGYLAARYGLTELSISGLSPEAEPSPKRLSDLSATIKREGITTVFYEPRVPHAAADTLARDAHVKTAVLDPYESTRGDYLMVMHANLRALRTALGCS